MINTMLLTYRVRARNTSADSENKIHDDAVAASYGFGGGLVPGITVYAYMTAPIVERFGLTWLERGSMQVRFLQPFYDGEAVIVRADANETANPIKISITAAREDGTTCASALASVDDGLQRHDDPRLEDYPEAPLPSLEARSVASKESLAVGTVLGTLTHTASFADRTVLESLDERLPIYSSAEAVTHPFILLRLANEILMRNYKLGPWIHAASDLINFSAAREGEEIFVRGKVAECFDRKGHEFVVLDLLLAANTRVVQQVRHTAIYQPRRAA